MIQLLKSIRDSLLHLAFPHVCEGCGSDILTRDHYLCLHCIDALPATNFFLHKDNPVEALFWGRLPIEQAGAQYYYTKESMMQHLMQQLKYGGHKELGHYLGRLMGCALIASGRFDTVDAIVPLPLHASKERRRGYNQAEVLCKGIEDIWNKPVLNDVVVRTEATESQTRKNRVERWQNMEGKFRLQEANALSGKHVLLVDDVVTTGATLEACGKALRSVPSLRLSIATLCYASSN